MNVDFGMLVAGIVFSDSIFMDSWFLTLTAFVAAAAFAWAFL
jgi:hypothetical protein